MTLRDRDLISIQEARQGLERASAAQKKFATFSQQQVDAIVEACAEAATAAAEQLARAAVEETGYGNVPDKIIKNRLGSVDVPRAIRGMKTIGILREDREKGIVEMAEPVGVIAAVIPSTNPTSTTIYNVLIALKAGNSVVLSPHPSAMKCICQTVSVLQRAALKAGAPEDLIVCLGQPTMEGTRELMRSRLTGVILATGGAGLVRAAYSSGRPAFGVGPGNVPSFIERTAMVHKAVADIFAGKTFDYGTICSSEQAIVAEEAIREEAADECERQGGHFLDADETRRVGELVFRGGSTTPNPQVVGRAATVLAEMAGIKVRGSTRVLIAKLDGVGREYPLSAEKLSPILAFYSVRNLAAGMDVCTKLLQHGGLGHTASIHSQSEAAVKQFGLTVPAFRIAVNTSAVHGSIGYSTNLFPAMTLGCGSHGGNITSDNIGPQHLMNIKRVAWESRGVEHRTIPADQRMANSTIQTSYPEVRGAESPVARTAHVESASSGDERKSAAVSANPSPRGTGGAGREVIAQIVGQVLAARGIPRRERSQPEHWSSGSSPGASEPSGKPISEAGGRSTAGEASRLDERSSITGAAADAGRREIAEFVCEMDVRTALHRDAKIIIGPKTIITPAARDLGNEHNLFVLNDGRKATRTSAE